MKRNMDRTASYSHSDTASESNSSQDCNGGACFGGWISSMLGGEGQGQGQGPWTKAAATNTTTNDDPTALVAEELNKLSLQEREIVYEDLHGVSMVEDESNEDLVNKRLDEMKSELENIPRSKKVAYLIAMEEFGDIGKEYCHDRSLHLMFLRADRWDSKKAAIRFVGWLDWKLELFGHDVLCHRHITLDKLEKESQNAIQSGLTQILPQRDSSGRTVICDNIGHHTKFWFSRKSKLQFLWYIMMATVEDDVETQRIGIVYIIYTVDGSLSFTTEELKTIYDGSRLAPMLPVRLNCVHSCFNNPKIGPLISMIQRAIGSHLRARFRSHTGNHTEVQYSLMTYGVPVNILPVTTDGKIKKTNHLKWYKRRKTRDSTLSFRAAGGCGRDNNRFHGIDLPGRFDVLLGKGESIQQHMGNRRFKELISIHFQEYDAALHGDKKLIAEKLLRSDLRHQGYHHHHHHHLNDNTAVSHGAGSAPPRFLKRRDDGWWAPVTHEEAIDKVSHLFRAYRLSHAKKTSGRTSTQPVLRGGEITNVQVTSSSPSMGNDTTTASSKRVKVELQDFVEPSQQVLLSKQLLGEPSRVEDEPLEILTTSGGINNPIMNSTTVEDDEWPPTNLEDHFFDIDVF